MSDRQSHFPAVSVHLCRVLDDVGLNTLTVNRRRQAYLFREKYDSMYSDLGDSNSSVFFFGSQVEGTTTPGLNSDSDALLCRTDIRVIQEWADWQPGVEQQLLMIQEDTAPGYCRLQLLRSDVTMAWQDIPSDNYTYDRRNRVVLKNTVELTRFNTKTGIHLVRKGPAETTDTNEDIVSGLACSSLCIQADRWTKKRRHSNWPTHRLIRKASKSGFFLVPVGHKLSENDNLEWRISFSLTERFLMLSMNITQLKCYVVLKMIMKCLVIPYVGESLSSYHCKTALFYCTEDMGSVFWREDKLMQCITKCLSLLLTWVRDGRCPHYVIPESNLFDGKINPWQGRKLVQILNNMIQSGGRFLLLLSMDDLGRRLQLKLGSLPQHDPVLDSENTILVIRHTKIKVIANAAQLKTVAIAAMVDLSTEEAIRRVNSKIIILRERLRQSGKYTRRAARLSIEFLACMLASMKASTSLSKNDAVPRVTMKLFHFGAKRDIASRLKLASAYFCDHNLRKAEKILRDLEIIYERYIIQSVCGCYLGKYKLTSRFARRPALEDDISCSQYFGLCVIFAPQEIHCVPPALRLEMAKMNKDDPHRENSVEEWKLLAVVDSRPYLFYLQYLTYGQLGKRELQVRAQQSLQRCAREDDNLRHLETAWNLLGHCMEVEERWEEADSCYTTSLEIRPKHNAATWHIQNLAYRRIRGETTPNVKSMVKTKNTPRSTIQTICPDCKNGIKPGETFEEHVLESSKNRDECAECGQTFRKQAYPLKHQRAQHQSGASTSATVAQASTTSDESDWAQNEPDVMIGEEEPEEEVKRSPKKMSLVAGRIVRKATKPNTPLAQKKRKAEATTGSDSQTPKRKKAEATPSLLPEPAADKIVKQSESDEKVEKKKNDVVVKCQRGSAEQTIEVEENGEVMYRNSVINKRKQGDSMEVSVGDLIPEGNIKSSDLKVCFREGHVELKFTYIPDQ